jgi:hypothetical protein
MTGRRNAMLTRIDELEAEAFRLHRMLAGMNREIGALERRGRVVPTGKRTNIRSIENRIGELCDQLIPLYAQRNAGETVKQTLCELNGNGRPAERRIRKEKLEKAKQDRGIRMAMKGHNSAPPKNGWRRGQGKGKKDEAA